MSGLERAIQRFLDNLEVERGLSANTLAAYGTDLHRFSAEIIRRHGERVRLDDVSEADVLAYLEQLAQAGMAGSSQTRHLAAIRGLFRHFKGREVIASDPTEMIERPCAGRALPSYLSIEEIDALIVTPRDGPFLTEVTRARGSLCVGS